MSMTDLPTSQLKRLGLALAGCTALICAPSVAFAGTDHGDACETIPPRAVEMSLGGPLLMAQADTSQPAARQSEPTDTAGADDEDALVDELTAMLQACSYDGKPLQVSAAALARAPGSEGEATVREILRFTGLPQNFKVVEGKVPNAAAMIVLGPDGLPQRVIAYNAEFMKQVSTATERNDWASISIMAHEIGHHLSGHTLMPGGSQPPLELEADKFSGFVLYKMGAPLNDAQTAIATLVPEEDGPTHPGRARRLAAIESGWTESCDQQPSGCDTDETLVAANPPAAEAPKPQPAPATAQAPAASTPAPTTSPAGFEVPQTLAELHIPGPMDIRMPGEHPSSKGDVPIPPENIDRVPRLDAEVPGKLDRFVYDEVGIFNPEIKQELLHRAYAYAALNNVEIVTIVAKDLQGRSADQYAMDVMRQLRVGKLEVGNGAVLVVAPEAKQVGLALGPGLSALYADTDSLRKRLQDYLDITADGGRPQVVSDIIVAASSQIMRQSLPLEWVVRYQSLDAMMKAEADYQQRLKDTGEAYDPKKNPVLEKLVRVEASIVTQAPAKDDPQLGVNTSKERGTGPAMHVRTPDGQDALVYVNANVKALMPSALEDGRRYSFVLRDTYLTGNIPQFDLVSYDLLQ